jgi:hypothetical protein
MKGSVICTYRLGQLTGRRWRAEDIARKVKIQRGYKILKQNYVELGHLEYESKGTRGTFKWL